MAPNRGRREGEMLLGLVGGLACLTAGLLGWQVVLSQPISLLGLGIDRLSATLGLLVTTIGSFVLRFSLRYLDGDPGQRRFLWLLTGTVLAAYTVMLATNLLLLLLAWLLSSLGLHFLLTHYPDRAEARRPARKKFLISRLGDLALIAAIVLIWRTHHTLDLKVFLAEAVSGPTTTAIGLLITLVALTKSAQFPFHSWLPETMEAPTPVSALMHAGVINAGGALLLRFSPLLIQLPEVLLLLSLIGSLTMALGMLAMWAQLNEKRMLAWSTVGQMGFIMIQCGLGAFPAALLHIVGHGCYKAWSFLRSGETPYGRGQTPTPTVALALAFLGTILALAGLALASGLTGFHPLDTAGDTTLALVVALSVGQLWVALLGSGKSERIPSLLLALGMAIVVPLLALALYQVSTLFLQPVLGSLIPPSCLVTTLAAVIPLVTLVVLVVLHAYLPVLTRSAWGRAFYIHSLHGFYLGAMADRLVNGLWSHPEILIAGDKHA